MAKQPESIVPSGWKRIDDLIEVDDKIWLARTQGWRDADESDIGIHSENYVLVIRKEQ